MNALAQQQATLLKALWLSRPEDAAELLGPCLARADAKAVRGLRAYRSNGRLLAERALAAAYPNVEHRLGPENFAGLARAHWLRWPPAHGDVAQWGARLAAHIEEIPQLVHDEPELANIARIDWALHCAATAPDAQPQLASLKLLLDADPARITLRLAPATACVGAAIVWRQGLKPQSRLALDGETPFVAALLARRSLAAALDAAPQLTFDAWLAQAVQQQLVLGARRLRTAEKTQ